MINAWCTVKAQVQDCGGLEQMISRDPTHSDSLSLEIKLRKLKPSE